MGSDADSQKEDSLVLFWQERPEKYRIRQMRFEEVRTPWDVYLEGSYMGNSLGNIFHQMMVRNGLERIFSLRGPDGYSWADVMTMPANGRILSPVWCFRRGLKTSYPMTIDGQELIVLDVLKNKDERVSGQMLEYIQDFYVAHGGKLTEEHPTCITFKDRRDIHEWETICNNNKLLNLHITSELSWPIGDWKADIHAINADEALALMRVRYWKNIYLNGDEPWAPAIVEHCRLFNCDLPVSKFNVIGESDQAKALDKEVKGIKVA